MGAFSLGVLMHQIICSRYKFASSDIKGGAFVYPNATTGDFIIDVNNKSYNKQKIKENRLLLRWSIFVL